MSRGLARASATASLVISWNRTRRILPLPSPFSCDATCQAIASPSRSGSVASRTRSAALAAFLISARVFAFSFIVTYFGVNPFSTSTPSSRLGRSRRCPAGAFSCASRSLRYQAPINLRSTSGVASLPTGAHLRKLYDLGSYIFRTLCFSEYRRIRLGVEWIALREELLHTCQRIITHQTGPGSRRLRAARCHFGARLQIDDVPARFCGIELTRLRRPAAAWHDDRRLVRQRGLDFLSFHLAKRRLGLLGENQRDRFAFLANQDAVDVHESRMQQVGDHATDRRFPRARQSDQDDVPFHDAAPRGVRARTCAR